ncbi:acyl-CoA dehydrogenase family protein [Acaryochloris sp. CCMEE 5410]|uniref:acyl-CoA dehydrogenase family protein n=1 Tax=Acaryochloris sp. CCMEE 5410 TaxID=310037 RepID=UPI000248500B|nr:acyl-CoA dehydrogenase family protein [Acaryochloris sp. CCMEE 5410]KAI9130483.1 acyl-CoA/acyl-ACP dehydrogenase [Acaryochloris sp. CCMEE 5410]
MTFLEQTEAFLRGVIAPQAIQIDQGSESLFQALQSLGTQGLLGLRVPQEWGGQDLDELTFRQFQEQVSRYSGALAFLQTQHQSAASLIAHSTNTGLQEKYLPHLSSGQVLVGIGFSHLRRQNPLPVQAIETDTGYEITGEVPWVTGYGCFNHFIVGAQLADGRAVFGLVPLATVSQAGGMITCSNPLPLAAMGSTQTVKVRLNCWQLLQDAVVVIRPPGWIHTNDQKNSLHHSFFALGCAQAGLDILSSEKLPDFVDPARQLLDQELQSCRLAIYQEQQTPELTLPKRLQLRAWAIELANRCAHAAVISGRGGANLMDHPAQRVYREALAFSVFGQTTDVMEASLARLVRSRS